METQSTSANPVEEENFAAMLDAMSTGSEKLRQGERVRGIVIAITDETVFFDVGAKVDGVMERKELLDAEGTLPLATGDTVDAYVVSVSPQEVRLSRQLSGQGGLAVLEDAQNSGIPVEGRVVEVCKGGYSVNVLGTRAFCPGSQMDIAPVADPTTMVGRTLSFAVTRVENHGRNVVVSRRVLLEKDREEAFKTVLATLAVGDTVEGRITRLAPFGAFMEIAPGVEGMVHISELGWARVQQPDEAVSLEDVVRAKVLSITDDPKGRNKRIALSIKQASGDPWATVEERIHPGDIVEGKVTRLVQFGAFVEVLPGIEGLIHLSEMSWGKRVHKAEDVVTVGEKINCTVKSVEVASRRLSLSLRDASNDPWTDVATQFPVGATVTGTVEKRAPFGLFVNLAPAVTGLLPNALLTNSAQAAALNKLVQGDSVNLAVNALDIPARKITLAPTDAEVKDETWKEYKKAAPAPEKQETFGSLGSVLQDALKKK